MRHVKWYGQLLCAAALLLSSVENKICGKIQCRSLGTFVGLLAPLLLPLVFPILAKFSSFLFPPLMTFSIEQLNIGFLRFEQLNIVSLSFLLGAS
jgi:hypothetical protein